MLERAKMLGRGYRGDNRSRWRKCVLKLKKKWWRWKFVTRRRGTREARVVDGRGTSGGWKMEMENK